MSSFDKHNPIVLLFLFFSSFGLVVAQNVLPGFDENSLVGVHWRYYQTVHVPTQTVVHTTAQGDYEMWFRFNSDNILQQYVNKRIRETRWSTQGYLVIFEYRGLERFRVAYVDNENLFLEFEQGPNHVRHQFRFRAEPSEKSPIALRPGELPTVVVRGKRNFKGRLLTNNMSKKIGPKIEEVPIQVELLNGGFYGGIDPVLRDQIVIKTDGRVIMEFKTQNQGLIKNKKNVPREELERLVLWAVDHGFFNLKTTYDCENQPCEIRKGNRPKPMPMRLAITYGQRRKVVTVSIWQMTQRDPRYVDYPPLLDQLVDAVVRMANQPTPRR
jgi:hypothetical protein